MKGSGMRAGEAAESAGVSVKALRYYEESRLLRPVRRSNGYRNYSETDVRLACEIRTLMSLGLTTQQTRPFLECLRAGHGVGDDCPESLAAYQHKIDELDRLIARLTGTRHPREARRHARGWLKYSWRSPLSSASSMSRPRTCGDDASRTSS